MPAVRLCSWARAARKFFWASREESPIEPSTRPLMPFASWWVGFQAIVLLPASKIASTTKLYPVTPFLPVASKSLGSTGRSRERW